MLCSFGRIKIKKEQHIKWHLNILTPGDVGLAAQL